jgi:hypothetical protein
VGEEGRRETGRREGGGGVTLVVAVWLWGKGRGRRGCARNDPFVFAPTPPLARARSPLFSSLPHSHQLEVLPALLLRILPALPALAAALLAAAAEAPAQATHVVGGGTRGLALSFRRGDDSDDDDGGATRCPLFSSFTLSFPTKIQISLSSDTANNDGRGTDETRKKLGSLVCRVPARATAVALLR